MDEMTEVLSEGTIPTEEPEIELQSTEGEEPSDAPQAEEKPTEEGSNNTDVEQNNAVEDTMTLQFNHEEVKVSKDEAVRLAQYGMYLEQLGKGYKEDIRAIMSDLDYFATLQGKSVRELVSGLVEGVENSYREELAEQFGADNPLVEEMLELRRGKNKKLYEESKADREAREKAAEEEAEKSANTRLAEQFESLREVFPEYDSVDKIPDSVFKKAIKSGDLEKELLRFDRSERNKIEAAKASKEKNNNQNVGSVQSVEAESGTMSAFMSGLWG